MVAALLLQPREVGHAVRVALGQLGIESVEADDDHSLDLGFALSTAGHELKNRLERPDQDDPEGQQEGAEQHQERACHGKSRAWAYISDNGPVPDGRLTGPEGTRGKEGLRKGNPGSGSSQNESD